ncbi:hypothetical protein [Streptomyces sp. CFMR 7]|uniref:hypothetical protein n=1 Tax=Streptomyces sp. CFMR 7 TaxID=1649184 RepID=UPI0011A90376|nr:hypothetical protein [Streptomyces sp. CFMR 7]
MNDRTEYIAGIRAFADWLENNPTVPSPGDQRLLLALSTNSAVEEFAAQHNLAVVTDDEGNMSAELTFGSIAYHAYGYVDFGQHVAAMNERRARKWAEEQGLEIRKAGVTA